MAYQSREYLPPTEIYLSSKYGQILNEDGKPNDVQFILPRPLVAPESYSLYLRLLSFTLPISWFPINARNNEITLNTNTFTLTPGNYSASSLMTALNLLIAPYSCTFDQTTCKVSIASGTTFTVSGSLCSPLGIVPGSSGMSVSSAYTVDLTGAANSVYVMVDCSGDNIDCRDGQSTNVLCRVPITAPLMGIEQFWDPSSQAGMLVTATGLSSIRITLEDEDRNPIECTLDWEATLQCHKIQTGRTSMSYFQPGGLMGLPTPALDSRNIFSFQGQQYNE
jgi:hypothetical protein